MKRIGLAVLAATIVAGALFATGAEAHKIKFDTSLSAKYDKPNKNDPYAKGGFDGAVSSSKNRCRKFRTVNLYFRSADGQTKLIGADVTDSTGVWALQPSTVDPGTYYAEVTKKVLRKNRKHRHICVGAVSRDVKVK